jgi:sec-independent protein translocase protein TatC
MLRVGRSADDAAGMPLLEHLRELRSRVVKAAVGIILGMIVAFLLRDHVIGLLENQVCRDGGVTGVGRPTARCPNGVLTISGATAGVTLAFKVALFGGLFLAAPVWLYQFWAFLAPGLYKKEKRYGAGFIALAVPLFAAGCATCFLIFPKIIATLLGRTFTPSGVSVMLPVDTFLTFYLRLMAVFGISFVLPLFLVLFNMLGILTGAAMFRQWRVIVLLIFVFSAVAVPTGDPIGMSLLALPICVLYFAAVMVAKVNDRRRARRVTAEGLDADQASTLEVSPADVPDPVPASPVE